MKLGDFFNHNQLRIKSLTDVDWKIALSKCKTHIRLKLKQKTLSGVHSASNLGANPTDHYLSLAYERILTGEWEWKVEYTLVEQMFRIINSTISTEVEKARTIKGQSFKITYSDQMDQFYEEIEESDTSKESENRERLLEIENSVKGDSQLEFIMEALKEGKKRAEIANLMDVQPRQFDKLREKLIRRIKNAKTTAEL